MCSFNLPWFEELLIVAAVVTEMLSVCVCSFNLPLFVELLIVAAVVTEMLLLCVQL